MAEAVEKENKEDMDNSECIDIEIFLDKKMASTFSCILCNKIPIKPFNCMNGQCLDNLIKDNNPCPKDNKHVIKSNINIGVYHIIQDMHVLCPVLLILLKIIMKLMMKV